MKYYLNRPFLVMATKLSIYLMIFFMATPIFALDANGQTLKDTKVSISTDKATLLEVFDTLERQTPFRFVYDPNLESINKQFTYSTDAISMREALELLSKDARLKFSQINRSISVTIVPPKVKKIVVPIFIEISGIVTDGTGEPLPGATVQVKGTNVGTTTDFDGNYSFEVPDDAETLVVSYIGFKTLEVSISGQTTINVTLQEDAQALDEVIVKGIRKSLSRAVDIKKLSVNSVDAIVAEDIAKFPQANLSEAVQRVSGIQIRRDNAGGVGNEVSVRGLPPEYTQVTLNGQAAPNSSEASRTYNFNTLPAELFGTVEVFKSPTAKLDEGGIGGVVNLKTRQPLTIREPILVATAEGLYNTQGDKLTPKLSLTYGKNWNNKFGILAGVSYNRFLNASQGYDVVRYRDQSFDTDGDDVDDITDVRVPLPRYVHQEQDVDRLAFNFGAQYRPTDSFMLTLDAIYSKNKQTETRYAPIFFIQGVEATNVRNDGPLLLGADFQDARIVLENQQQLNDTDVFQTGLTGKWNLDTWQIVSNLTYSTNNRFIDRPRYYAENVNTVSYSVENDLKWFDLTTPTDLTDASQFIMTEARARELFLKDKIVSGQFDITKEMNVLTLDFGAKYRSRKKERTFFDARINGLTDAFAPVSDLFTGFLDNVDEATGPEEFLVHDWDKARALYAPQIDLANSERKDAFYDITENIAASYLMGTFKWTKFNLNAGVRLVNTSLTSKGLEEDDATGVFSDREIKSSYTDLLPSFNASYEIGKDFFLKGAFARVMTRPSLSDLSAFRFVDDVNLTIREKNPDLDPFRANQYEISAEWYPTKEALISAAFFVKDIESFITTESRQIQLEGQTYDFSRPVNGNNAVIKGLELNYQQPFTFLPSPFDGLGIVANYTLSDSSFEEVVDLGTGETESYELPNNSKHSYNLIGYYEKYGFSLRVAHNYRSNFLRSRPVPEDGLKFRDDYGQTDISAGYEFNDHFGLTFNVLNAFNSRRFEYIFDERFQDNASVFGTTYQIGARYSF